MPFDAVVATSLENVYYLSGAFILTQRIIPARLAFVLWPNAGAPVLGLCTIEESLARTESKIEDIRGYTEFKTTPIQLLADVLREKGLHSAQVGIEMSHLPVAYVEELRNELPGLALTDCGPFLETQRMVKSQREARILRDAARRTDDAIWDSFQRAGPGKTEIEISAEMQGMLLGTKAQAIAFCVIGTGRRASMAHPLPTRRVMKSGDLIRTDFGGTFDGYYSDIARTAVAGKATPRQRDTYARLWSVHHDLLEFIRPGIMARDVFHRCRALFEQTGLNFRMPHVGHSLGIGLHEYPMLAPHVDQVLVPGMILAIEPMHIEEHGQRYHLEDLVEVTERGRRMLTSPDRWSKLVEGRAAWAQPSARKRAGGVG